MDTRISGKGQGGPGGCLNRDTSKLWAKLVQQQAARQNVKACTEIRLIARGTGR